MERENEVSRAQPMPQWYHSVSYNDAKIIIRANLTTAARSFIAVGFYLKHVRDTEGYREDGFADIWEFAQAEYGISMSTASRYMSMNDRFSQDGNSPLIRTEYKDFGKSQLQEMLSLTDGQLEQVQPTDRVEDIRNMRRPREIPYMEIPGQVELTDFPGVDPADVRAAVEAREQLAGNNQTQPAYTVSAADLLGEDTSGPEQPIAISQQRDVRQEAVPRLVQSLETEPEPEGQPDLPNLPLLKNNDQRAAFVDAYESWPLWIETVQTGERYYRYDLEDGTSMVVKVYHSMLFAGFAEGRYESQYLEGYGRHEYYLLQPGKFFRDCEANRSTLIDKLKEIQKVKKGD